MIKQFSIPAPILSDPGCEYFKVEYQKISPIVGAIQTISNFTSNTFSLDLDSNSIYEIKVRHHCCDGNDSEWTYITYDTTNNVQIIYVCMNEFDVLDTCATTPGNCRNCEVTKSYKIKFFSDQAGNQAMNLLQNTPFRFQEVINGVLQPSYELIANLGNSEYDLGQKITYSETCVSGNSTVNTYSIVLLDGQFQTLPYQVISCISNSPSLTQTSNTVQGSTRTQVFNVGNDILQGNKFELSVYNVTKQVIAITGDTPTSIAQKLRDAINNTNSSQWNIFGTAPIGQSGFPPVAQSSGANLTIDLNSGNTITSNALQS